MQKLVENLRKMLNLLGTNHFNSELNKVTEEVYKNIEKIIQQNLFKYESNPSISKQKKELVEELKQEVIIEIIRNKDNDFFTNISQKSEEQIYTYVKNICINNIFDLIRKINVNDKSNLLKVIRELLKELERENYIISIKENVYVVSNNKKYQKILSYVELENYIKVLGHNEILNKNGKINKEKLFNVIKKLFNILENFAISESLILDYIRYNTDYSKYEITKIDNYDEEKDMFVWEHIKDETYDIDDIKDEVDFLLKKIEFKCAKDRKFEEKLLIFYLMYAEELKFTEIETITKRKKSSIYNDIENVISYITNLINDNLLFRDTNINYNKFVDILFEYLKDKYQKYF